MYKIVIVAYERFQPSALSSLRELFHVSNQVLSTLNKNKTKAFEIIHASLDGRPVCDHLGTREESISRKMSDIEQCDAVIFLGTTPSYEKDLTRTFLSSTDKNWIQQKLEENTLISSILSGTFLLAEAGVLNEQAFTLCPNHRVSFCKKHPELSPQNFRRTIKSNNVLTGYIMRCWLDIGVEIIKDTLNEEEACQLLDALYIPHRIDKAPKQQSICKMSQFLINLNKLIENTENLNINSKKLADMLAMSERTLSRKARLHTNKTPKQLIDDIKIKKSCQFLTQTDKQIKEIAYLTGYSSDTAFRRNFVREMGICPTEYRQQA